MNDASSPAPPMRSRQLYWILQTAGWGFYTSLRILGAGILLRLPWARSALELAIFGGAGLATSHWLRDFARRHRWASLGMSKLASRIVVASLLVSVPFGVMTQLSDVAALQDPDPVLHEYAPTLGPSMTVAFQTALQIANWAVLYMIWLTIYFAAVGLRDYRTVRLNQSELARALQLAELRLLKSQVNPHFLFNALNTVRSLIADNPAGAQSAVTRLANTLRYTLSSRHDELVTFARELQTVREYLELEAMRFEGKLRIETEVPESAARVHMPVMLLQTLVENAIKHGIAELPAGGLLRITARLENEMLNVEIENPRPPTPMPAAGEGVGLSNARNRLRLLFGARATLELDLSNPTVATARLRLPQQR